MNTATLHKEHAVADKHFEVDLPEEVVEWFGWQDKEVPDRMREALVMELLRRHVISQGKAAELLGISRWDVFDVMGRYQVPAIDLTAEELKEELAKEIKPGKRV
jgi:predicted HTH domain antitoxin